MKGPGERLATVPGRTVEWFTGAERAGYSLSALRILYGVAIVWFLIVSFADRHYLWGIGSRWVDPAVERRGFPEFLRWFFPKDDVFWFDVSYGLLLALSIVFLLGFATRIVTPLLLVFWVALSTNSVFLTNGGDLVIRLTLLFLVFANLSRHWSLDAWIARTGRRVLRRPSWLPSWVVNAAHNTAVVLCGYQIVLIYVNSGVYKLLGEEWTEGSALYYALNLDVFRVFPALSDLAWQFTPFVLVGSWVSIWAQLLFPVLLLWRPSRYAALVVIMGMHLGIGLFLGLWPFSMVMIALDLVFIRDSSWERGLAGARSVVAAVRGALRTRGPVVVAPDVVSRR